MAQKNQLVQFGLIPFAGILVGFMLAVAISLFILQSGTQANHALSLSNSRADSLQQQLNINLSHIKRLLLKMSNSDRLAQILDDEDASAISIEESELTAMIPYAIKVWIFRPGEAVIDQDAIPEFNFTSLDLVNQAEAGEPVNPEAIFSQGRWIISVATPITNSSDDEIKGSLFVYLGMEVLEEGIKENVEGELKLVQKVGATTANDIALLGAGKAQNTSPMVRTLNNPHWTLEYTPSPHMLGAEVGSLTEFLYAPIAFLLIALIAVYFGISRSIKLLNEDLSHLDHQIASVASGLFKPSDDYQIDAFTEVETGLSRLGKKRKKTRGPVPKLKVKSITPDTPMDALVDIEMLDEEVDEEVDDVILEEVDQKTETPPKEVQQTDPSIFRAYDIRGIVDESLTTDVIHKIGLAIGSEAKALDQQTLLVGGDGRLSTPEIMQTLIAGLRESGRDVIDIGAIPTPVLYFATHNSDTRSGVMVTGSHNPAGHNGFKIVLDGRTLVDEDIQKLYQRIQDNDFSSGEGKLTEIDFSEDYMDAIIDDIVVAQPLTVAVDCGNGIAGEIFPELLSSLGCDVVPLYCDVDGNFPNHPPDPIVPENLEDLILTVKAQEADIGIALDGDGDRIVAITKQGEIVWPDRLLMLFAKDVVSRNPGSDVVYDVKCTRHLNGVISGFGGRPILCRSGHSFIKAKMAETDAILGGEMSGHICFSERWFGFDDGLYAAARLLEIVGSQTAGLDELLEEFPSSLVTPEIQIQVDDQEKFTIIEQLKENASFSEGTINTVDGIRVDYADGWGLVRASNTNAALTLRFEADSDSAMKRIKNLFKSELKSVRDDLNFE